MWVPSAWARDVFAASGVDPAKLVVVPEGVNTTWWVAAQDVCQEPVRYAVCTALVHCSLPHAREPC